MDNLKDLPGPVLRELQEYLAKRLARKRSQLQELVDLPELYRCQGECKLLTKLLLELRGEKKEAEHARSADTGY
jgi:hypothetical protein